MGARLALKYRELSDIDFKQPVKFMATMLTKCKSHIGTKLEIFHTYKRFVNCHEVTGLYVASNLVRFIFDNSNVQGMEMEILKMFSVKGKVNMMEIFSVIVQYSAID